jgi:hypothetical protein
MLETSHERVKLLKAGITGKTIERLYIMENNFRIVRNPIFLELVEIDTKVSKNTVINQESAAEKKNERKIILPKSCSRYAIRIIPAKKGRMVM